MTGEGGEGVTGEGGEGGVGKDREGERRVVCDSALD